MFLQSLRPGPQLLIAGIVVAGASLLSGCSTSRLFGSQPAGAAAATTGEPAPSTAGVTQSQEKARLFGVLPIYRPDIQQGNFISREMVAQLRVGMTPEQVRFVLGTPLIADAFHENRWDYPFRIKNGEGKVTSSHVSVFFKDGRVSHFEGGDLPEEKDYLKQISAPRK